jgi:hypothetical protein
LATGSGVASFDKASFSDGSGVGSAAAVDAVTLAGVLDTDLDDCWTTAYRIFCA